MNHAQFWGGVTAPYEIDQSLRFRGGASVSRGVSSLSANTTFSAWFKLGHSTNDFHLLNFDQSGTNRLQVKIEVSAGGYIRACTQGSCSNSSALFRDYSGWYHVVIQTTSSATNVYVNNVLALTRSQPAAGTNGLFIETGFSTANSSGYVAEAYFVDGSALAPTTFAEEDDNGVWRPIEVTGLTYGTNGFYLKFDPSATNGIGHDYSGNGNNYNVSGFDTTNTTASTYDVMSDTPTNNFCTWFPQRGAQTWTFSNGNLDAVNGNFGSAAYSCIGTIAVSTGKWYWEVTCNDAGPTGLRVPGVGIMGSERNVLTTAATVRPDVYLSGNGTIDNNAGTALQTGFSNMTAGDIIGVAVDADAKTVQFYRNGSAVGTAQSYTADFVAPSFYSYTGYDCNANFGQRAFAHTPPTGFNALSTSNFPAPTIKNPSSYMDVVRYTGTGAALTPTSNLGFSPNLVWIKGRSGATDHALYDTVRGVQQQLESNTTTDETTEATGLTAFNSNGFTVGALAQLNTNTATYVAWCWDESATPGFDIVTYTGNGSARTIAHSLGVAPSMMIVKARTTAGTDQGWAVYHSANTAAPATDYLVLNTTAATADLDTVWNDTAPTSSVFSVGTNALVNTNNDTYVAYLWSEVAGFSRFGSYTGNGNADGPFVYCGFKPKWLMVKLSTTAGHWVMIDAARNTFNAVDDELLANTANTENGLAITTAVDFTSNGFKIRTSDANLNSNTQTLVFAAFAEHSFGGSGVSPATAR